MCGPRVHCMVVVENNLNLNWTYDQFSRISLFAHANLRTFCEVMNNSYLKFEVRLNMGQHVNMFTERTTQYLRIGLPFFFFT